MTMKRKGLAILVGVMLGLGSACATKYPMREKSIYDNWEILEKDTLTGGRVNIKRKTGETIGYMQEDTLSPNRINLYDKYGNKKGFFVKDNLNSDAWLFKKY